MRASDNIIKIASTFFCIGYLPLIPGTFASVAGAAMFYFIKSRAALYCLTLIITLLGLVISGRAERVFNQKDADCIVIDEVSGMLVSFLFIPCSLKLIVTGFLLFRFFDIIKPYPAYGMQRLSGGMGVMADDIVSGIYTNILLQFLCRSAVFIAS